MLKDSLHSIELLNKEEYFLKQGKSCTKIGKIEKGILRGFIYDNEGEEITTHFYQEGDIVIGSFLPNTTLTMNIQAMEDSKLSIANYEEVMSWVNKDEEITSIITQEFQKLNQQIQNRVVTLLNLTSIEKYKRFLIDYPGLLNRIPHYYIANYLGITPTQLSRARKQFSQQM
ncbi:Crp/Fnr family transcriptional regulator [uncultured Tenacibaculum sp.]|uniref:Crp/Fnr family transcriptional regulator n=1 Tax=uncultured Tenacibaculum sp. TaxID=174713 RepID=UPI0026141FFE|nr:Crp/Fnr family transcriptional regulator [uncultured Tenacibaculum sp.]